MIWHCVQDWSEWLPSHTHTLLSHIFDLSFAITFWFLSRHRFISTTMLVVSLIALVLNCQANLLPNHRWRFVAHPHRLWSQKFVPWSCSWRSVFDGVGSDAITTSILREGCCSHDVDSFPVFLLTSAQARACLANHTFVFSGDSYTMQLFIGLADILSGEANKFEIVDGLMRRLVLGRANNKLRARGINAQFVCHNECYGSGASSLEECSQCMNQQSADARIIGTAVHLLSQGVAAAETSIANLIKTVDALLWVSGPAYNLSQITQNKTVPVNETLRIFADTLGPSGLLRRANRSVSFLDVMSMTRACYDQWNNCSADGGHNRRFVERMKAMVLLNILCEPVP